MPRFGGPSLAAALCAVALIVNAAPVLAQDAPLPSKASKHGARPPHAARAAEARKTFSATCAACHGLDGHGASAARTSRPARFRNIPMNN